MLGHGGAQASAAVLADRVLRWTDGSMARLGQAEAEELSGIPGIGPAHAARIVAALELGRRVASAPAPPGLPVSGPGDVWRLVRAEVEYLRHEEFHVLILNAQNVPICRRQITRGILDASLIHPREVFRTAIVHNAASLVLVHNHPSGNPEPSPEDLRITDLLTRAGEGLGIPVVDHVIVGRGAFVSLAARGALRSGTGQSWHGRDRMRPRRDGRV